MAKKTHDLAVKTGEFTDRNGDTKARWMNVGALMTDDKGQPFLLIDPLVNFGAIDRQGRDRLIVSCFEPRDGGDQRPAQGGGAAPGPRQGGGQARPQGGAPSRPNDPFPDDDIPF
jgi:hypothetical protein